MTALIEYERLESPGLWRASPLDQKREVVASIRSTSLVLSDPKTDMPLAHWSLPAIRRTSGKDLPATYCPGTDATETLELHDDLMINALDRVQSTLERRKPHPGRLRGAIFASVTLAVVAVCTLWLPNVLIRQTATILPEPNRAELGQLALADVERLTGTPCRAPLGQRAASALSERLLGKGAGRIMVMRDGLHGAMALPGGLVLISRDLVEAPPDAETAAGFIIAALAIRGGEEAQLNRFLHHAGLFATLRLLVSGRLPENAMDGIGEVLLAEATAAPTLPAAGLLPLFQAAEVSSRAYASALSGNAVLSADLKSGDPFQGASPRPVLEDANWISLQTICFDE